MSKKVQVIESMALPKGVPVQQYSEDAAGLAEAIADLKASKLPANATPESIIVGVCNKYSRQKDALVDFRDWLWTTIKARTSWTGFKTEKVKQGDKEVTVEAEPEQKNINRFVTQLVDGTFTHKDFNLTGITNEEQREAAVWAVLQKWTDEAAKTQDKIVDGEVKGTEPLANGRLSRWAVDLSVPERKSKPKTPPDYATKAAESIFADVDKNGAKKKTTLTARLEHWFQEFTRKGIVFEDFRTGAPEAQKVALAWAVKANEDYEREQRERANPYK